MNLVLLVENSEVPKESPLSPLTTSLGYVQKPMEGMHLGLFWGPVRGTPGPSGTAKTMGGFAPEPLGPYFEGFQK